MDGPIRGIGEELEEATEAAASSLAAQNGGVFVCVCVPYVEEKTGLWQMCTYT